MAPAMRILVLQGGHGHYEGRHAFQHVGPGLSQVHALHARHDKAAMLVQVLLDGQAVRLADAEIIGAEGRRHGLTTVNPARSTSGSCSSPAWRSRTRLRVPSLAAT
ncbi:hypothetical protein G6F63_014515 [Rhizopus arrhizus]|nr:hypothetical protein G6F63_014515 [Rhizopus arrhizus]